MVEYEYPELFEEHESVHFIIVNSGATVTIVSGDAPTITDEDYVITENEMKQESFSLTESLCSLNNLKFGIGESANIKFTVYNIDEIPNLEGEEITVYIYFNEDSDTLFRVGTYVISEDEYSPDRAFRNVLGYDVLNYLWDYDITAWYNQYFTTNNTSTIGDLRNALFTWLGQQNESYTIHHRTVELVNDDVVIEKGIDSDVITFGFLMQPLLEVNGVFMHVDREGYITYIQVEWYDKPPVKTYTEHTVFPPFKYEDYETWGIGYVLVFDKDDNRIFKVGSTNQKHPSNYTIVDSFVFSNEQKRSSWKSDMKDMLANMRQAITHLRYRPCEFKAIGNLCYEPGDRVNYIYITYDDNDEPVTNNIRTYIWKRTFSGIQGFKDLISAKGDKKQPKYKPKKDKWHQEDNSVGSSGIGTSGISLVHDDFDEELIEKDRNKGFRYLDEPNIIDAQYDSDTGKFKVKWEDPIDLIDNKPVPCIWAKTYVVESDAEKPPKNIYQGTIVETSTTRDEYKTNWFEVTVEKNKRYYFALMPEDTKGDVRWTKVISLDTSEYVLAPTIISLEMGGTGDWDGSEIVIMYSGDSSTLTVKLDNGHIVFTLYSGQTSIYSWQSPIGSGVNDVDKIHVSFLKDDNNYLAKPSFIYETANGVYSYNQESPTNIEMENICSWLNDDGVLYDIVNVTKTNGALTPYQEYNQSTYFIYNLRQYFGTGNVLRVTTSPSVTRTYTYDNGVYTLAENDTETLICIPLNERCYVKSVSCKVRLSSSTTNRYYVLFVSCIDSNGVSEQNNNKIAEYAVEKTGGSYYGGLVVNDTNWHTIRFDVNGYADYICFDISYSSAQIKDVVIGLV